MQNPFGYCLRGSHPSIDIPMMENNHVTIKLHHVAGRVDDIQVEPKEESDLIQRNMAQFFYIENMGTCCSPKCGECRCGTWSDEYKNITIRQEREMNLIHRGLHYDKEKQYWTVE